MLTVSGWERACPGSCLLVGWRRGVLSRREAADLAPHLLTSTKHSAGTWRSEVPSEACWSPADGGEQLFSGGPAMPSLHIWNALFCTSFYFQGKARQESPTSSHISPPQKEVCEGEGRRHKNGSETVHFKRLSSLVSLLSSLPGVSSCTGAAGEEQSFPGGGAGRAGLGPQ